MENKEKVQDLIENILKKDTQESIKCLRGIFKEKVRDRLVQEIETERA